MDDNQMLNTELYKKMFAEQESYRDWLLSQPPEEILNHCYEYTVREDIVLALEYNDLTNEQCKALLDSPAPLSDVFGFFEKMETGYMDDIRGCIEERANDTIARQKEKETLLNMPVYPHTGSYAREHGELEQYRASHNANISCRDAIDNSIRSHYDGFRLSDGCVKDVVEKFGFERTFLVLANTVQHKDWDGRISRDNKVWAATVPILRDNADRPFDPTLDFVVDRSHPGLLDLFVTQARREFKELEKDKDKEHRPDEHDKGKSARDEKSPDKLPRLKKSHRSNEAEL